MDYIFCFVFVKIIIFKNSMKKKEMVNKGTKSKSTDISHKKVSVIKKVIKK